jgi:hypothetical protein
MKTFSNGVPLFEPIKLPKEVIKIIKTHIKTKEQQEFKNRKYIE